MWPWEHLAFGYALAHVLVRLTDSRIDTAALLAILVGTQLADLVDKPLAWGFGVLPSGTSLAHSLAFATPLAAAVALASHRRRGGPVGVAFAAAYASHLLGDILYPVVVTGRSPDAAFLLWPLVPAAQGSGDLLGNLVHYLGVYLAALRTPRGGVLLLLELGLLGLAVLLWHRDGRPGLDGLRHLVAEARSS